MDIDVIKYHLDKKDVEMQLFLLVLTPGLRSALTVLFFLGVGLTYFEKPSLLMAVSIMLSPTIFIFFLWCAARKIVKENSQFLEEQNIEFRTDEMFVSNSISTIKFKWNKVRSVKIGKKFVVFRFDSFGSGLVIPVRSLNEEHFRMIRMHSTDA